MYSHAQEYTSDFCLHLPHELGSVLSGAWKMTHIRMKDGQSCALCYVSMGLFRVYHRSFQVRVFLWPSAIHSTDTVGDKGDKEKIGEGKEDRDLG